MCVGVCVCVCVCVCDNGEHEVKKIIMTDEGKIYVSGERKNIEIAKKIKAFVAKHDVLSCISSTAAKPSQAKPSQAKQIAPKGQVSIQ